MSIRTYFFQDEHYSIHSYSGINKHFLTSREMFQKNQHGKAESPVFLGQDEPQHQHGPVHACKVC